MASWYFIIALIAIGIFVFLKVPYLDIPFYWDEAWVYGPAVLVMEESGPCLLPECISQWLHTGHPLLFYFLASSWMKLFGANSLSGHLFALFVSTLTLASMFFIVKEWFGKMVGLFSVLLLMTTAVFAAQSGIMVPEVLLTLFSLWAFYFYTKKKFWWYFLFAVLVLYVKESGAVLICAVSLHGLLFASFKGSFSKRFVYSLSLFSPILVGSLFYISQYFISGYFFYPRHLNWVDLSIDSMIVKFNIAFDFVFKDQGRIYLSVMALFSGIVFLLRGKFRQLEKETISNLMLLVIFIVGFLSFCCLNYLSNRYMLSMIPIFLILVSFVILNANAYLKGASIFIIFALVGLNFYSLIKDKKQAHPHDISLSYKDMVEVHVETIEYLKELKFQDKKIVTHGLMHTALSLSEAGYLSKEECKSFVWVNKGEPEEGEIVIYSTIERDDVRVTGFDYNKLELLKEFRKNNCWCRIYKVPTGK